MAAGAAAGYREVRVEGPEDLEPADRTGRSARSRQWSGSPTIDSTRRRQSQQVRRPRRELRPQDLDHFRVTGCAGQEVAIEVEARRLGVAIAPLVTVMSTDGRPLHQSGEGQGVNGDCLFLYRYPRDGDYVIQVRDLLYGGARGAWYRLRVTDEPFATALFPLGAPVGSVVTLTAAGGNLAAPIMQAFTVPEGARAIRSVPPFESARASVNAPLRIVAGDGPESFEPAETLEIDRTLNGRIDKPGEIDRYRLRTRKGERVTVGGVVAASLGSWLDSVVAVRTLGVTASRRE